MAELGSDSRGFLNVVGMLVEDGHVDQARALLTSGISTATRDGIIARLAAHGDPQAQVAIIDGLTAALESGRSLERPRWQSANDTAADVVAAASRLADAALVHGDDDLSGFALSLIHGRPDEGSLALIVDLAANHGSENPWLSSAVEQMTGRIATREVLRRLPDGLDEVAAEFETRSQDARAS